MTYFFVLFTLLTSTVFAQPLELEVHILTPKEIKKTIGSYPKKGSVEETKDYQVLLDYQAKRTLNDCLLAEKDSDTSLNTLFGGENGILSKDEVAKLSAFVVKVYANAGVNSYIAKHIYKRPRPYEVNKLIKPCIGLEKSYAYPSGHTLMARLFARILSKVFPERMEKFLARSGEYSLNRIIGGVHHPSDVEASFKLADLLAENMMDNEEFINELTSL